MNKLSMRSILRSATPSTSIKFLAGSSAPSELQALSNTRLTVQSMKVCKGRGGTIEVVASAPTGDSIKLSTKISDLIDDVELG